MTDTFLIRDETTSFGRSSANKKMKKNYWLSKETKVNS